MTAAALALGAAGVWMGTRFVASREWGGGEGEQQAVLSLGGQVLDFSAGGSYCAVLTGTGLTVYDPDMEQASSMQSTLGARRVDMGADGTAVLADSQRAWLYIPG